MVLSIADGQCTAREGEIPQPTLKIISPGDVWLKIARGEIPGPKALMGRALQSRGRDGIARENERAIQDPVNSSNFLLTAFGAIKDKNKTHAEGGMGFLCAVKK